MKNPQFNRRAFLKVAALGIGSISMRSMDRFSLLEDFPASDYLGRVVVGKVDLKQAANADSTTILCTKIVMNPDEKETIEAPSKGKQVTTTEYNEIIKKKMEEMREMYRGRRGGGKGFRK